MKIKIKYILVILLVITITYIIVDNNKLRKYNLTLDYNEGHANISLDTRNTFKANKIIKEIKNIYKEDLTNIEISLKLKKYLDNNIDDYLINTNGTIISKNTSVDKYKIGLYNKEYYHFVDIKNNCLMTYKGSREITIIGKDLNKINSIYKDIKNKDVEDIDKIDNYQIIIYDDKTTVI